MGYANRRFLKVDPLDLSVECGTERLKQGAETGLHGRVPALRHPAFDAAIFGGLLCDPAIIGSGDQIAGDRPVTWRG